TVRRRSSSTSRASSMSVTSRMSGAGERSTSGSGVASRSSWAALAGAATAERRNTSPATVQRSVVVVVVAVFTLALDAQLVGVAALVTAATVQHIVEIRAGVAAARHEARTGLVAAFCGAARAIAGVPTAAAVPRVSRGVDADVVAAEEAGAAGARAGV